MRHFWAFLASLFVGLGSAQALVFHEIGDAGDLLAPQSLQGSGITEIQGNVGGADDPDDAFRFSFAGGKFGLRAELWDATCGEAWSNDDPFCRSALAIGLLSADPTEPVDPCIPVDPCRSLGYLELADLSAGNYVVGVCIDSAWYPPNPCLTDPPFTISFGYMGTEDPPTWVPIEVGAPVPEPDTAALLLAALFAWWNVRRLSPTPRQPARTARRPLASTRRHRTR